MKILMLDNEFPPLGGGMGTANQAVLREFSKAPAVHVDLITSALGGKSEVEQLSDHIRIYKVPVWNQNIHHSSNRELSLYTAQALIRAIGMHRENSYDFSFAWSAVPAGAVSLALRELLGLPYYVWVSGPDIPGFERRYERLYSLITPLLRRIWKRARRVIAKCTEEVDMIRAVDDSFPVEIIENGVDLDHFSPKDLKPVDGTLRVICSARLIERKGQRHLIQAVHRLLQEGNDISLELVGDGDAMNDYRQYAAGLGLNGRVEFAGYVPREQIQEHLQRAHVFALPSYNEGMALAALEAMGCGLPVVLTRTGGTGALVEDGVNGFSHTWGDVEALTAALRRFVQDRSLVVRMGASSRQRALAYGWEALAKRYLELFELS